MSLNFEKINDEVCKKFIEQANIKDYIWVSPNELPPNYPLENTKFDACCLPLRYKEWADKIRNFEVFPDDVWLVTYPKSGTTWTQEMVYLLKNNLNYEKASKTVLNERFPFLELESIQELPPNWVNTFQKSLDQPRPRLIKTHLPVQLLPVQIWTVNPKIIYVFRQPKDVAVSYFHHHTIFDHYSGGMEDYVNSFVNDFLLWGPYYRHISGGIELNELKDNVLLTKYEDMKMDLPNEIKRTMKFLELDFTEKQIMELAEHLSIDNMKKNPSVNFENEVKMVLGLIQKTNDGDSNKHFIRNGVVGGWKNELTPEMVHQIDEWSAKNIKNDKILKKYL